MNDNEDLAARAEARLGQANEMYRQGKDAGTVMSVLLIALWAREIFGPAAAFVRLEPSDQGEFMSLSAVLDAEGNDLSDTDAVDEDEAERRQDLWDTFSDQAESSYAWNLNTDDSVWEKYLAGELGGYQVTLPVDETIARIRGQL